MISFVNISLGFDQMIHVYINYFHVYASFDCSPSLGVRGILLDMPKAFDKVYHEGLIYQMKCFGLGVSLKLLQFFFQKIDYKEYYWVVKLLMGTSVDWCATGIYIGPPTFPNLYKCPV